MILPRPWFAPFGWKTLGPANVSAGEPSAMVATDPPFGDPPDGCDCYRMPLSKCRVTCVNASGFTVTGIGWPVGGAPGLGPAGSST